MHYVSLFPLVLSVLIRGSISFDFYQACEYIFKPKHLDIKNNYYNNLHVKHCPPKEVPNHVDFVTDDEVEDSSGVVNVVFAPPKIQCMYKVALLVNPLIKNERECEEYVFERAHNLTSKTHTQKRSVCHLMNTYNSSKMNLYEDKIELEYRYVFPGCYALQFYTGEHSYIIGKKYVNTTYQRVEVKEPQIICRLDEYSNIKQRQKFILDITLPSDTGDSLLISLFLPRNQDIRLGCSWSKEPLIRDWTIDLGVNISRKALTDENCDVKLIQRAYGRYEKFVRCYFQLEELPTANYCLLYSLYDDRCDTGTIWKPPHYIDTDDIENKTVTCSWVRGCVKSFENTPSVVNVQSRMMSSDKLLSTSSYLLLPIIAIVLIVSAIIGILCFWHYLRIRKEEVSLYVNSQHDDSDCLKSIDFGISDSEKGISHDNLSCDDVILLYTNNSTSFMALMKDFRQTLAEMCSCSVHDWHDGAVWNEVAKVGAVSWFTELLNNGCRVVWIDTPATRSIIMSRNNESNLDKFGIYYKIHDFRDMAFRVVLEVAKSKVNDVTRQYRKNFIVRFEEIEELKIESMVNVNDPFLDLSPHARYYMPRHLVQLCSDLSVVKTKI